MQNGCKKNISMFFDVFDVKICIPKYYIRMWCTKTWSRIVTGNTLWFVVTREWCAILLLWSHSRAPVNMIHVLTTLFRVSFFLRVLLFPPECNHVDCTAVDVVVVVGFRVDRVTIVAYTMSCFIALHSPFSTDVTRHCMSYEKLWSLN